VDARENGRPRSHRDARRSSLSVTADPRGWVGGCSESGLTCSESGLTRPAARQADHSPTEGRQASAPRDTPQPVTRPRLAALAACAHHMPPRRSMTPTTRPEMASLARSPLCASHRVTILPRRTRHRVATLASLVLTADHFDPARLLLVDAISRCWMPSSTSCCHRRCTCRCPSGSRPRVAGSPCRQCCSTHTIPDPNRGAYWQRWCSSCHRRCE
jgi:hypothetical protein